VSIGNGIYKSTDGGDSWTNMGLQNSEHIAKIIVDPRNSNTVYACVPGNCGATARTAGRLQDYDGGKSWSKILKGCESLDWLFDDFMNRRTPRFFSRHVGLFAGGLDFPFRAGRIPPQPAAALFSRPPMADDLEGTG